MRRLIGLIGLGLVLVASPAWATVDGTLPAKYQSFRVFGKGVGFGNTLMSATTSNPLVNQILLPNSTAAINGIPSDATIRGAYIFWSASTPDSGTDSTVDITWTDSFKSSNLSADRCVTVNGGQSLGTYYYCRRDITALLTQHRGPASWNGEYLVGGVNGKVGVVNPNNPSQCAQSDPGCQGRYAGWSMVIVYDTRISDNTLRDVIIYDGFMLLDARVGSAGIFPFTISDFLVGDPARGTLTAFALEGDEFLGVPPQDSDPDPNTQCSNCFDFLAFNGTKLQDERFWPNNIFNSSNGIGVDIDTIDISSLLKPNMTTATITVGSGDGSIPTVPAVHGYGELFLYGYTMLSLDRLSPNFRRPLTTYVGLPNKAGPGETITFQMTISNEGSIGAENVVVKLDQYTPTGCSYVPNSTKVDGADAPGDGAISPLRNGLSLGNIPIFPEDFNRTISWRCRIDGNVTVTKITSQATISYTYVNGKFSDAVKTPIAEVEIVAPKLQSPQKTVQKAQAPLNEFRPGDTILYRIVFKDDSGAGIGGIDFTDDMPPEVKLLFVISDFDSSQSNPTGGVNGTGRVVVKGINAPPGGQATVTITAQILSVDELIAKGITTINGHLVKNQGTATLGTLTRTTDDPTKPGATDTTDFTLTTGIDISATKSAVDLNGGVLKPGETVRYTISVTNKGTNPGTVNIVDNMPTLVGAATNIVISGSHTQSYLPPPSGSNQTGLLTISNWIVPPGGTVTARFDVPVLATAKHNDVIQNKGVALTVKEDASQNKTIDSNPLTINFQADLQKSTKTATDVNGGEWEAGDQVRYTITVTNSGTKDDTNVVVTDVVDSDLINVVAGAGGTYNAQTRTMTWTIGTLKEGETRILEFTAQLPATLPGALQIDNTATIRSDTFPNGIQRSANFGVVPRPRFNQTTKTVTDLNGGDFEPGDTVRYTITVKNNGSGPASNVVVRDPIDPNLTDVDASANGGTLSGSEIVWNLGTVQQGETKELVFTAKIKPVIPVGTQIKNQAKITATELPGGDLSDDPGDGTLGDGDPTVFNVKSQATLTQSLKAFSDLNGGVVQPGDELEFTITLKNTGNAPADKVVIRDVLVSGLTKVAPQDGGVYDGNSRTVSWTLATPVNPGSDVTVRVRVTIDPAFTGDSLTNQGSITSASFPGVVQTNVVTIPIVRRPDFATSLKKLEFEGTAPEPGKVLTFVIDVKNTGTKDATNVVVRDPGIDANLTVIETPDGSFDSGSRTATWTIGTIKAGETRTVRLRATINIPLADQTEICNQAFITFAELPGVQVGTISPTTSTPPPDGGEKSCVKVSSKPKLKFEKTYVDSNGLPVKPNDLVTFTLALQNDGTAVATNLTLTDKLDANLTFVSATDGGTFDATTRTITWVYTGTPKLVNLELGEAKKISVGFVVRVKTPLDNGTEIPNQAEVSGNNLVARQLSDDPATTEPAEKQPDPTILKVVSGADFTQSTKLVSDENGPPFRPGDVVLYTIVVKNTGDATGKNVTVSDTLPAELEKPELVTAGTLQGNIVRWSASTVPELANLAPGQEVKLSVKATIKKPLANGTKVINQAEISADGVVTPFKTDADLSTPTPEPTVFEVTAAPNLQTSTKTVEDPNGGKVEPGDQLIYTITVKNTGDAEAVDIEVKDTIDTQKLTLIEPIGTPLGVFDGQTITWKVPKVGLSPTGDVKLQFRATVMKGLANGTLLRNEAQLPNVTPNPFVEVTITSLPKFETSTKELVDTNGGFLEPGDAITYTITVKNSGPAPATNVTVSDTLPPQLDTIAVQDGGTLNGGTVTWVVGNLAPDEQKVLHVTARIKPDTPHNTLVKNTAVIKAAELPDETRIDQESTVISGPLFTESTKSVVDQNGDPTLPGDVLLFTIRVKNTGNQDATNVVVEDEIDATTLTAVTPQDGGTLVGQTIRWNLGTVKVQETRTVTFRATVSPTVTKGAKIRNVALIRADKLPEGQKTNTVEIDVFVPDVAITKIAKTQKEGVAGVGETVTYTITVENKGDTPATGLVIRDRVDLNSFSDVVPQNGGIFNPNPGEVVWQGGALQNLAPKASVSVSFTAKVKTTLKNGDVIHNNARLQAGGIPNLLSNDVVLKVEILPNFSRTEKRVFDLNGGNVEPGDRLRYVITVRNDGPGEATEVVVEDRLTLLLSEMQIESGGKLSGKTIHWDQTTTPALAKIPAGGHVDLVWIGRVPPTAKEGTEITDQAFVKSKELPNETPSDDPTTDAVDDPTTVKVKPGNPFNFSSKEYTDPNGGLQLPGDTIEYTIKVVQYTGKAIDGVVLTDAIPGFTTYIKGTTTVNGTAVADINGLSPLVGGMALGSVGSGDENQKTVRFRVRIEANAKNGTVIKNQATISAPGIDPFTTNSVEFVVGRGANLKNTTKTVILSDENNNNRADIGEVLSYTILVENRGNSDAKDVVLRDPIPKNSSYVAGSLVFDGQGLTDAADNDAGELTNESIVVRIGTIAAGASKSVTFKVKITAGPSVSNQGVVTSPETGDELTDADGDDLNGNQPTVTPVGDAVPLSIAKSVQDLNGGTVDPKDQLLYPITVKNDSTSRVEKLTVVDTLPETVRFLGNDRVTLPQGATLNFVAGRGPSGGTLTISGIAIDPSKSARITVAVELVATLKKGDRVCNEASLNRDGGGDPIKTPEPACVVIGSATGSGTVRGVVFQDIGTKNGVFDPKDYPFSEFQIMVWPGGEGADTKPVASAVSDQAGKFDLKNLDAGPYRLRVLTGNAVFLMQKEITVKAGETLDLQLAIDPTGRVYNAKKGDLIRGMVVSLIYDKEDPIAPGQPVPGSSLVDPSQQDQVTDVHGLYKFELKETGRRYQIVVKPPSLRLNFPSTLIPPTEGFAVVDSSKRVVENELPDVAPKTKKTYYLRFRIDTPQDEVFNNHLPIDPLESLIQLDKRANKTSVRIGDIITYTIKVQNRSTNDLKYDPNLGVGGVYIRDILPPGFKIAKEQALITLQTGDRKERIPVFVPTDAQLLIFGKRDGAKKIPLDLPAGATLTMLYQVVVGSSVQLKKEYENRAVVTNDGGVLISNEDTAKVKVVPDPIFDQGTLIGKVFCDANKNGWQDKGEEGLDGVKIYLDNGYYSQTDRAGKFHFYDIDAGTHMVKIDKNTLPPGSELTTDESRIFYFTRGLMQKANFGVLCRHEVVGPQTVTLADPALRDRMMRQKKDYVTIKGRLAGFQFSVDDKNFRGYWIDASIAGTKTPPNLAFGVDGLKTTLAFSIRTRGAKTQQGRSLWHWRLQIAERKANGTRGDWVREFHGRGLPPDKVIWNGKDDTNRRSALKRGRAYLYRITLTDGRGSIAQSPWRVFGVDLSAATKPLSQQTLHLRPAPSKKLQKALEPLIAKLKRMPDYGLVVKVHTDGTGNAARKKKQTETQAQKLRSWLIKKLKVDGTRLSVKGMGGNEPMVPNFGAKNIRLNRRIEIALKLQRVVDLKSLKLEAPSFTPGLTVNGTTRITTRSGYFLHTVKRPAAGFIVIGLTDESGQRYARKVDVRLPNRKPARKVKVSLFLDLANRRLQLSNQNITLDLLSVRATGPRQAGLGENLKLKQAVPFRLEHPLKRVRRWYFNVYNNAGDLIFTHSRAGMPPSTFNWEGADNGRLALTEGTYRYRFVVESPEGHAGMSAEGKLKLKKLADEPSPKKRGRKRRKRKRTARKGRKKTRGFASTTLSGPQFRKGTLGGRLRKTLERLVKAAKGDGSLRFVIEIHSGGDGSEAKHLRETKAQAQLVRAFLRKSGLGFSRYDVNAKGKSAPLFPNFGAKNIRKNFRVAIKVLKKGSTPLVAPHRRSEREPLGDYDLENGYQLRIDGKAVKLPASGRISLARDVVEGSDLIIDVTDLRRRRAVYVFSIEAPTPLPKRTTPKRTTPTGKTPTGKTPTGKTPTGKTPKNGKPKNGTSKRPLTTQGPDARLPLTAQTPTAKRPTSQSRLPKPTRPLSIEDLLLAPPNPRQLVAPNVSTRTGTRPKVGSQPIEAPTPLTAWLPDPVEPNQKPPAPTTIRRPTKRRAKFPFVEPTGGSELPQFGLVLSPQVVAQVKPKRRERLGPTPFGVRTRKPKKSDVPVVPFGDSELMRALRTDNRGLDTNNVAAAKLRVYLPPRKLGAQAVTIKSDTLAVRGETDPQNEITVNGRKAKVRKDGKFSIVVPIPWGKSKITIVSKDKMGNQAQIVWPVERAKFSWFLLAMAEGVLGQKGAKLDGMNQHTKVDLGPVYLHGKSAVYFKAWIKGSKLFKEYFITAHMDTSKLSEFEEFFKETINPEKYYPVFGDSSTLKQDAVSRGKFYVLLQADQSKLTLGNFRTAIKGIELLNYDRPFYGVMVDFKKTFAKNYKTELKTFVSWDNRQYKRGYNLFRGTGGSIYYLRHTELLDGSEKVKLVVRDRDNGTVLMEIPQSRNTDYTIRYSEGRIYLKSPVPSVVDASFLSTGYLGSRNQIDGHPVYLEVSYEYQGTEKDGDVSFGAHVKQTFFNMFTIGGGYIQEGRKGSNTPTYRLYGGELTFHYKKKTKVTAELTRSHSSDAFNMLSEDGGLTFKDINLTGSGSTKGWAYKFTGEIELGEYFGKKKDWIFIKGFYSRSQPGFYSYGTILEQGSEKFGGEVRWHITARDMLTVRHDGVITQAPDPTFEGGFRSYEKELSTLQYKHQRKIWQLVAEYNHIFTKDSRDPKGINGDTLAIAGTYKILKWLDLSLQQEFVIHGDSRILTRTLDHFKTTVGVGFQIAPSVKVTIAEELRWSGENTTVVGFRTKLDDKSEFYVEERMKSQRDTKGWLTTTVIGAQQKMGKDGKTRSYGEYQLDTGIAGLTNRAVMGFGRRFTIIKGLNLEGLYERSQTFGGIVGNTSRDAFSVSLEILRWEFLKAATKFEVRYDNGDNKVEGSHDKIQYITMNTINAKVHEDVTLFGRFNYSQTGNITLDIREAELMEATFGLAYRPVKHDWVNLLIKYTHLLEMRPLNLIENSIERTSQDVVSLELVFELPFHLQLAEKIAFKRMVEQIDALASIESMTLLWINRLSYHLYRPKKIFGGVDVAVEYRQLHQFLARDFQHGVLLEVAVLVTKFAKIGVGWNFTKFTDNEFSTYDKNESGFFFRVVGRF